MKSGISTVSWVLVASGLLSWIPSALHVADPATPWAWAGDPALPARMQPLLCNQAGRAQPRDIVFEWIEPGELDEADIRDLTAGSREIVAFRWSASTGELSYETTAPTAMFSDLVVSSRAAVEPPANCGSR